MSEQEIKEDFSGMIEVNGVKVVSANEEEPKQINTQTQNQQENTENSQKENQHENLQKENLQKVTQQKNQQFMYPQNYYHQPPAEEGILTQLAQNKKILIIAFIVLLVSGFLLWKFYM